MLAAAQLPTAPICIDSDDEGLHQASSEGLPQASSSLQEGDAPAERIVCQLMIPNRSAARRGRMLLVGSVSVAHRLVGAEGGCVGGAVSSRDTARQPGPELEFVRHGDSSSAPGLATRVPTRVISHMAVTSHGQMIFLKLLEAISADQLGAFGVEAGLEAELLDEFALVPHESEVRTVLTTLRWWLPHVVVQGSLPAAVASESAAALRLDGIALTGRDIQLLGDERCLNDSVLDFFLRLVMHLVAPDNLKGDVYLASTFFFQKLTSGGVANGEEGWHNVRRWTRSLPRGLLGQRFVIVPINEQNIHWWLAVVCNPRKALQPPLPSETVKVGETPRIVCLDSAQEPPPHCRVVAFLRGYLWREWRERDPSASDGEKLEKVTERLQAVSADVPKQANCYDCGIFIIEFLCHLLTSKTALQGLGLAPHRHWFGQERVSHRRKRLCWVALLLTAEAQRRSEHDVGRLLQDEHLRAQVDGAFDGRSAAVESEEEAPEAPTLEHPSKRPRTGTMGADSEDVPWPCPTTA
ncbi:unnamed protein product [Polarella glacialis]|uniref:Ubiquitin-like protease family profile domain-containing protein n=1 Tax=Polarella glacialis TaxID=89957 RepID=A0A813KIZ7_POLGL|nr:unnamed protein product [Polarella glacialis]